MKTKEEGRMELLLTSCGVFEELIFFYEQSNNGSGKKDKMLILVTLLQDWKLTPKIAENFVRSASRI